MSDYCDLKEDVTALDTSVELILQRIRGLKEALKGNRTLSGETALLQELTAEIVALRELRQALFTRRSLLREHENGPDVIRDGGNIAIAAMR